jgi:hypothetical protein
MSETSRQALKGLKAAKDILAQKAVVVKLNHQLNGLKRAIGEAAYRQGIDCGEVSQKAATAAGKLQQADQRATAAAETMKRSSSVKDKTLATKDVATAKAAHTTAQAHLNSAYEVVGQHVLVTGISVPGKEKEIVTAVELQRQISSINQHVGELGSGLTKNKVGLAAVACILLVVCGVGWHLVGGLFKGTDPVVQASGEEKYHQELEAAVQKAVALADSDPEGAAEMISIHLGFQDSRAQLAEIASKLSAEDQKKFIKIRQIAESKNAAMGSSGEAEGTHLPSRTPRAWNSRPSVTGNGRGNPPEGNVSIRGDGFDGSVDVQRDGGVSSSFRGDGISAKSRMNADGSGEGEYDIGGQKMKIKVDSKGNVNIDGHQFTK